MLLVPPRVWRELRSIAPSNRSLFLKVFRAKDYLFVPVEFFFANPKSDWEVKEMGGPQSPFKVLQENFIGSKDEFCVDNFPFI